MSFTASFDEPQAGVGVSEQKALARLMRRATVRIRELTREMGDESAWTSDLGTVCSLCGETGLRRPAPRTRAHMPRMVSCNCCLAAAKVKMAYSFSSFHEHSSKQIDVAARGAIGRWASLERYFQVTWNIGLFSSPVSAQETRDLESIAGAACRLPCKSNGQVEGRKW